MRNGRAGYDVGNTRRSKPPGALEKSFSHEQGVERMNGQHTNDRTRLTAWVLVCALLVGALALAGCGGTVTHPGGPSGTGAPAESNLVPDSVRGQVLDALKAMGVTFDESLVSVVYGPEGTDHIIVYGPMTGPQNLATGSTAGPKVQYSQINLDLVNGKWVVTETK